MGLEVEELKTPKEPYEKFYIWNGDVLEPKAKDMNRTVDLASDQMNYVVTLWSVFT